MEDIRARSRRLGYFLERRSVLGIAAVWTISFDDVISSNVAPDTARDFSAPRFRRTDAEVP